MARSRRAFCLSFGAALAAAALSIGTPVVAAVVIPNVLCALKGTQLAPNAKADVTFKVVNKQPTFTITGNTFTQFNNKTLTLEIVRGKTKLLLTRVPVDNAGNISRSLRLPGTTVRVDDILQLTFDSQVVANGTVKPGRL